MANNFVQILQNLNLFRASPPPWPHRTLPKVERPTSRDSRWIEVPRIEAPNHSDERFYLTEADLDLITGRRIDCGEALNTPHTTIYKHVVWAVAHAMGGFFWAPRSLVREAEEGQYAVTIAGAGLASSAIRVRAEQRRRSFPLDQADAFNAALLWAIATSNGGELQIEGDLVRLAIAHNAPIALSWQATMGSSFRIEARSGSVVVERQQQGGKLPEADDSPHCGSCTYLVRGTKLNAAGRTVHACNAFHDLVGVNIYASSDCCDWEAK